MIRQGWGTLAGRGSGDGIVSFAAGLRQDLDAVRAAITQLWINGPVEGQVNRLKLIKQQMYGRAGFDLLQQPVLRAA